MNPPQEPFHKCLFHKTCSTNLLTPPRFSISEWHWAVEGVDGLKGDRLGGEDSLHWQGLAAGSTPAWESDVPHHPLHKKAEAVVFKWNFPVLKTSGAFNKAYMSQPNILKAAVFQLLTSSLCFYTFPEPLYISLVHSLTPSTTEIHIRPCSKLTSCSLLCKMSEVQLCFWRVSCQYFLSSCVLIRPWPPSPDGSAWSPVLFVSLAPWGWLCTVHIRTRWGPHGTVRLALYCAHQNPLRSAWHRGLALHCAHQNPLRSAWHRGLALYCAH